MSAHQATLQRASRNRCCGSANCCEAEINSNETALRTNVAKKNLPTCLQAFVIGEFGSYDYSMINYCQGKDPVDTMFRNESNDYGRRTCIKNKTFKIFENKKNNDNHVERSVLAARCRTEVPRPCPQDPTLYPCNESRGTRRWALAMAPPRPRARPR